MIEHTFRQLHWIAGLLEGEGSFIAMQTKGRWYPSVQCAMKDEDIIRKLHRLTGEVGRVTMEPSQRPEWLPLFRWRMQRQRPCLEWMYMLHPLMGRRRQEQIEVAVRRVLSNPPDRRFVCAA